MEGFRRDLNDSTRAVLVDIRWNDYEMADKQRKVEENGSSDYHSS